MSLPVPSILFNLLALSACVFAKFQFSEEEYAIYLRALNFEPQIREDELHIGNFSTNFTWASATSAYQIEGSWNVDGKGESIWDTYAHAGLAENGDTGDVACDSYMKYQEDIDNLVFLGVHQYRFSIAWTRIQPTGEETTPNPAGIAYYNNLIDGLLAVGIQPVVTLYHWDLPQALQDKGGWQNDTLIINAFTNYARICFDNFGDRVKLWITHNEPWIVALLGHGYGNFPPNIPSGEALYIVGHNLIRSHAEVYHLYNDSYRATQGGRIGITLNTNWAEAVDHNNASSVDAAMRDIEFSLGWFANPVFINGDYPDVMKIQILSKSLSQNLTRSRLPEFTAAEKQRIFNTSDFFGLNHYTTSLVFDRPVDDGEPFGYDNDKETGTTVDPNWPTSGSSWLFGVPFGMRKLLVYISGKYGNKDIIITENGISDRNSSITDGHRVWYYENYINNVLQAIDLDGVNVIGYTAWSLMDNFEWDTGFSEKFGLYQVNFTDPNRPRSTKDSVLWYRNMIANNGFFPAPAKRD